MPSLIDLRRPIRAVQNTQQITKAMKKVAVQKLRFEEAEAVARAATEAFLSGAGDRVVLIYNEFRSVMPQRVVVDQLLPIARADVDRAGGESIVPIPSGGDERSQIDYLSLPS